MIALDSSAIVSVALVEPEAEDFARIIGRQRCVVGWPTIFEASMVLRDRARGVGAVFLEVLLARPNVTALPFDQGLYGHARRAFEHYGCASGHPAKLNFGDCMAYAVARASSVPLLYKGNDFAKTDIVSAFS